MSANATASAAAAVVNNRKAYELSETELHFALPNMRGVLEDIEKGHKFIANATVLDVKSWDWIFIFADYPRTAQMLRTELGSKEEPLYLSRIATEEEQAVLKSLYAEDVAARLDGIRKLVDAPKRVCGASLRDGMSAAECARTVEARRIAAERGREANAERIRTLSKQLVDARNAEEEIRWELEHLGKAQRLMARVEAVSMVLEEEAEAVVKRAREVAAEANCHRFYFQHAAAAGC
jgi:hypothetical protein